MARVSAGTVNPHGRTGVRIVVAGDQGTGKSSLIITAAADNFPVNVPRPVLPPTRLPEDLYHDRVPITIIDTSSSRIDKVSEELQRADAVVLTYACDRPESLENLSTFWLPRLRKLEVKVPVIVVGCKLDLRDENGLQVSLEQVMSPIMQQFGEIETFIECSASRHIQVTEVFYYAQKAVLYPTAPLFDRESQTLKPRCKRALKRIFILCDHDRDGALSDAEQNDFRVKCFNAPLLQPSEIVGEMKVVQEKFPEGVNERGLTLAGFLYLHALFIEKGLLETAWTVLRKFGYNDDIKLNADDLIIPPLERAPDQSVELTNEAVDFLKAIFDAFDGDGDGMLRPGEIEELFSTAPENPWTTGTPYEDAAEKNAAFGGLSLDAFLSEWALMTLLNPTFSVENLIYIGYPGDPSSAIRLTRRRRLDRRKKLSERNVLQCFVFGPSKAGKSALLSCFIGRPYSENYNNPTIDYAVNVVDDISLENKKYLVLREIPDQDGVRKLLADKESLASCDIAVFVHDRSDESSWRASAELLVEIAGHGKDTGFEVPCLIVAAKDDLDSFPMAIQESTRTSQDMGVGVPIPISVKLGDFNGLFCRIVTAAEHPHLSIPETEAAKIRKQQYHSLINRSLMAVSVGAAVVVVGLAAYRVYSARKNASG